MRTAPPAVVTDPVIPITVSVYGKPEPGGSKRAITRGGRTFILDANYKTGGWKHEVAQAAMIAMQGRQPILGPVEVRMTFYLKRPKGHYGTGRNQAQLKLGAPPCPAVKPDLTKLVRSTEDALSGIVWRDDCQVVVATHHKTYAVEGERPQGADISVCEIR